MYSETWSMPVSAACMARGTPYFWMMSLLAPMWSTWPWVLRTTDGLELQVGDGRYDLLVVGAGVDNGAGAGLFAVDEVAVGLESADDDQLVLHARSPGPS